MTSGAAIAPPPGWGPAAGLRGLLVAARELTGSQLSACLLPGHAGAELWLLDGVEPAVLAALDPAGTLAATAADVLDAGRPAHRLRVGAGRSGQADRASLRAVLGIPVVIDGRTEAAILAARTDANSFAEEHERTLVALATSAAAVVQLSAARDAADAAQVAWLRRARTSWAGQAASTAVGPDPDPERVLAVLARRGRALAGVPALVALVPGDDGLVVASSAGACAASPGQRVSLRDPQLRAALFGGRRVRLRCPPPLRLSGPTQDMVAVPLIDRTETIGVLLVVDRTQAGEPLTAAELEVLEAFAVNAAGVLVAARSTQRRLRGVLAAAEAVVHRRDDEHRRTLDEVRRMLADGICSRGVDAREQAIRAALRRIDERRHPLGGSGRRAERSGDACRRASVPAASPAAPDPRAPR